MKHGIPAVALQPYKVGNVELVLENSDQSETQDTLSYKGIEVKYTKPLDVKPKVLARPCIYFPETLIRSGDKIERKRVWPGLEFLNIPT